MSDVQNTAAPAVESVATEPVVAAVPAVNEPVAEPVVEAPAATETATDAAVVAPVEEEKKADAVAEKVVEPITEGQLAYKGPGLLKSLIPSKKEFWLSDLPVAPQHLDLYLRGEKSEIAYPVTAWASHTGKGLLFFNKKGDTDRKHPHSVLALYDATDLKKSSPHEITFRLNGHEHTLKAANDAERDGWFISLEKAIELGKAQKEEVRSSEGYKAEIEKLNKPNVGGIAAGAAGATGAVGGVVAAARSKSQGKKSTELDNAEGVAPRTGSDAVEEEAKDGKKAQKSRSTSRGVLNRLRSKKEDAEVKKEEKIADKEEENKEAAAGEAIAAESAAPVAVGGGAAALDAEATAERATGAPVEEAAEAPVVDSAVKAEEKPKINKRNSIFGKVQGWGSSMKSPKTEKDVKEAELKPEVPAKDATEATEATETPAAPVIDTAAAETAAAPEVAPESAEAVSPSQKTGFLSGLPFLNKRNRSVSPSATKKEEPKKEEAVAAPEEVTEAVTAPVTSEGDKPFVDAPTTQAPATEAVATESPVEKTEEATTKAEKRQSVFGSLGRRASKALNRINAPKKEAPVVPATEASKEESAAVEEAAPVADKVEAVEPAVETKTEETPAIIGDVVPEAVTAAPASNPTVTASA